MRYEGRSCKEGEFPDLLGYRKDASSLIKHKILGGADMLLLPSRFEPAGSDHLHGMRYGTIPIVRSTGALDDAVSSFTQATGEGTGFKFGQSDPQALFREIRRAVEIYRKQRPQWRQLVANAMKKDFSWDRTALLYEELYRTATKCGSRKKGKAKSRKTRDKRVFHEVSQPSG